jgi:hypothetical protein
MRSAVTQTTPSLAGLTLTAPKNKKRIFAEIPLSGEHFFIG